ncbi:GSCFA domain-containing protein [Arenibacter sp. N53]|uniref:GSCFA domain-containing protein n=1 Tax=Arenibacter TaxID=178469 RepID=UPI000CD3DBE0|nr:MULTISPECIES: GSCFA domain-containing protein [Arenibacter]MCM4150938.1 GSCFA domain-containing protein [Arenibacter sp. N53]
MKLQTQIPLSRANDGIDYDSRLLLLGSCFAENIGDKFGYYKFQSLVNPFGILYQSMAIRNFVKKVVSGQEFLDDHMLSSGDQWQCLDVHSDLGRSTKNETLEAIENATKKADHWLQGLTHAVITLGTAWAYEYRPTYSIVANCHKLPQSNFNKLLLDPVTITASLLETISLLKKRSPRVKVILTISPVRHLKDGFLENQRSKANLITAVHEVLENSPGTAYFPAYEIMMDELRDYRFYDTDMVHPNQLAIDYIWEKFASVWIATESMAVMEKVVAVQNGLNHRPFNPESPKHQEFLKTLDQKITYLQKEYPFMKF